MGQEQRQETDEEAVAVTPTRDTSDLVQRASRENGEFRGVADSWLTSWVWGNEGTISTWWAIPLRPQGPFPLLDSTAELPSIALPGERGWGHGLL